MAYTEQLANRIRAMLLQVPHVKERKMFGGLAFMVDDKMCITVGVARIMCRIDPLQHAAAIKKKGCTTVIMGGREYIGYVQVLEDEIKTEKSLLYWIALALDFNKIARKSVKRKA